MAMTRVGRTVLSVTVAAGILIVGYLAWELILSSGATEGDVPDASRIELPAGSEVVGEDRGCASGGCWLTLTVRPPAGQSAEDLASEIGATPQLEISGNVFDPRTVWAWAEPAAGVLSLRVDYWSQRYVP